MFLHAEAAQTIANRFAIGARGPAPKMLDVETRHIASLRAAQPWIIRRENYPKND
jgi:hypothetical protein